MPGFDVTFIAGDGTRFPVWGSQRNPWITIAESSCDGLMDAPMETDWIEDTEGAVFSGERYKPRDMTIGLYIAEELSGSKQAGRLESDFRRAFSSRRDPWNPAARLPQVEVNSTLSGVRTLDAHLKAAPEMKMERDPYTNAIFDIVYELRAPQPLPTSGTEVDFFETSGSSGSGTVTVSNPTDTPCRHTWILTPGKWVLPDPSWQGPEGARVPAGEQATRTVTVDVTVADGGARITRERRKLHASTLTGANLLGRMNGNWVRFDIPPYTPLTQLPISVTGAPSSGARTEVHMPRLWSRFIGMEL